MMKPQILFCTLAIVMFGSTVYAQDADNDGYHDGDVAVIKAMVENNGYRLRSEMPDHWADWNFETPKRIEELSINYYENRPEKPLTGVLDVSKLDRLTQLDCNNNLLTGLNVSGLTRLTYLGCQGNQLTALDLSGCSVLKDLYCDRNQLTSLPLPDLTELINLSCKENRLTALDLSGCKNLWRLYCDDNRLTTLNISGVSQLLNMTCRDNPINRIVFKNGRTLNIASAPNEGGSIAAYRDPIGIVEGRVMLTVTPNDGYRFTDWAITSDVTLTDGEMWDETIRFPMPDADVTVTARYYEETSYAKNVIDISAYPPINGTTTDDRHYTGDGWSYVGFIYTIHDGADVTVFSGNERAIGALEVAEGAKATITLDNVTSKSEVLAYIPSPLQLKEGSDATLVLKDGTINTFIGFEDAPAIYTHDAKLTIEGNGTLIARGGSYCSGIGGGHHPNANDDFEDSGIIIIKSGTIHAFSGLYNHSDIGSSGRAMQGIKGAVIQPENQTVNAGETVLFSFTVPTYEYNTISYRWQRKEGGNWTDMAGEHGEYMPVADNGFVATNVMKLDLTAQSSMNGSVYRCIFTLMIDDFNYITWYSDPATLTVNGEEPPASEIVPGETQTAGADGKGAIGLILSTPSLGTITGCSFEVRFPKGITLDEERMVLAPELTPYFFLLCTPQTSNTPQANNIWLVEIMQKAGEIPATTGYNKIVEVAYKATSGTPVGEYQVELTNLSFMLSDGTQIREASLPVSVHVTEIPTANNPVEAGLNVWTRAGRLHITGLTPGEAWSVYNIAGAIVYSGIADSPEADIALPVRGIYIVRVGDRVRKIKN